MHTTYNGLAPGLDTPLHNFFTLFSGMPKLADRRSTDIPLMATLNMPQVQVSVYRGTLQQCGPKDGPGPISYLAERSGMTRYWPKPDLVDKFFLEIGEPCHA
jgi:hypothetical protein